jgi:hypothetical protein
MLFVLSQLLFPLFPPPPPFKALKNIEAQFSAPQASDSSDAAPVKSSSTSSSSSSSGSSVRDQLLQFVNSRVKLDCKNLTSDFSDGKVLAALVHDKRPDLVDPNNLPFSSNVENVEHVLKCLETLKCPKMIDAQSIVNDPEEKVMVGRNGPQKKQL